MAPYGTLTLPPAVYPGDTFVVAGTGTLSGGDAQGTGVNKTGVASERVALYNAQDGTAQFFSVEVAFDAAPGAFTIQVQTADTDTDASYVSEGFGGANPGTITTVNAGFTARVELQVKAKFARILMVLQSANNQKLTAKISR